MAVITPAATPAGAVAAERTHTEALIAALRNPACYPHPAENVQVLETHISYVLLAGDYAYKIKKPVRFGFVDFTSLAVRRFYCGEELRLNRRTAPQLYFSVVPITGELPNVHVGDGGPVIEYAVRMRRFDQSDLLGRRALERFVQPQQIDALAGAVARFHSEIPRAEEQSSFGEPESVVTSMLENFSDIAEIDRSPPVREALHELHEWARTQHQLLYSLFARRKAEGFVRECHGDLHLANIVLVDGHPTLFDALEFNERLRWSDVTSDVAFTTMDLVHHDLARLAARFLNRYLEETGDYGALPLLRYYMVYRALVRAKVAGIRAGQQRAGSNPAGPHSGCLAYLELGRRLAHRGAPLLVVMQGLSCSGKTTVSQRLMEALQAIRLRSDVERKRMAGVGAHDSLAAAPAEGAYAPGESARVYRHLARLARESLEAGY
ncbi:MAG: AAA family ATPase, partial [Betaproteobacteria bacterium]